MKLPAMWLSLAFAAGIAADSWHSVGAKIWIAVALAALVAGGFAAGGKRVAVGWALALTAWVSLGGLAFTLERAAVPSNHVTRMLADGRLDTSEPLRWRGRLREDPIQLPWGNRYEIDLESVEIAGVNTPICGGLRANLYRGPRVADAPEGLRAGDRVESLVRAKPPRNFLDPGAADIRGFLARQKIDLIGSLRSGNLLQLVDRPRASLAQRFARVRGDLLARLDGLFGRVPQEAALLRAMLLGDRSFVDSDTVASFQKTSAYHVLVVAGLHVGALVVFMFWLCRRLRLPIGVTICLTLAALIGYVAVVQDRPPILRAALMAAFYLLARPLFRRIDLLNTISLAALALLLWKPSSLADESFLLSFLAAGVIAGLALPWVARTSELYRAGLAHLGDLTRDVTHPPRVAQFRIELRAASAWLAARVPQRIAAYAPDALTLPIRGGLRLWDVVVLSIVIQLGMMPLLAKEFHRVTLAGPVSNVPAVILTGVIVPLGFLCLLLTFVWARLAMMLAKVVGVCVAMLLASVESFGRVPRVSYRVPGPPAWLFVTFLAALTFLAVMARREARQRADRIGRRQPAPFARIPEWAGAASLVTLAGLIAMHPFPPDLERGKLEITTLDVGQGDSIFAAFPDERTLLVDGGGLAGSERVGGYRSGPDVGEEVVSPYLWSRGLKRLDVVALTHPDHDHIDGLFSVLENFRVGQLWIGREADKGALRELLAEAHALGVPVEHEASGEELKWGGGVVDVLWPQGAEAEPAHKASNNDSLVMHLSDCGIGFLLTGDIEKKTEARLVEEHAAVESYFLKVPHHGSKTSSTEEFLEAVAPKVAVASVGEGNPFGHPAAAVVERYERAGVQFLRTDRDGAVTMATDGRDIWVRTFATGIVTVNLESALDPRARCAKPRD